MMRKGEKNTHSFAKGVILFLLFFLIAYLLFQMVVSYIQVFKETSASFKQSQEAKELSKFAKETTESLKQFREELEKVQENIEKEQAPSTELTKEQIVELEKKVSTPFLFGPYEMKEIGEYMILKNRVSNRDGNFLFEIEEVKKQEIGDNEEIEIGDTIGYIIDKQFHEETQQYRQTIYIEVEEVPYKIEARGQGISQDEFLNNTKELLGKLEYAQED